MRPLPARPCCYEMLLWPSRVSLMLLVPVRHAGRPKTQVPMAVAVGRADSYGLTDLAVQIRALSTAAWGEHKATNLVGRHPSLLEAQRKLLHFARAEAPVPDDVDVLDRGLEVRVDLGQSAGVLR